MTDSRHFEMTGKNGRRRTIPSLCVLVAAALLLAGCATRSWNDNIDADAASQTGDATSRGYAFSNRLPENNAEDVFVILAFSGGGMRSAAFSYGVLKALRDTNVEIHGHERSLLDEVDVISSVSGGSFTAAYYGLFGHRIFDDYEKKFLKRDVEGGMLSTLANPLNLMSLTSTEYNRGDLAAGWLDRNVFERKTFHEMSRENLPFIILNASDLNTGLTFSFIQQQFDFLCSDLDNYPVANAVMASSAVPGVFAPISVRNFDENCAERRRSWVFEALNHRDGAMRDYEVARQLERYFTPAKMPVVRLVDGGVTDNLGVRGSIMSPVTHYGEVERMAGAFRPEALDLVTDVLVVVANAQVYRPYEWSQAGEDPGLVSTIVASFDAALNLLNTETIEQAQRSFQSWADMVNARRAPRQAKVRVHFVSLTFEKIPDPVERERFNDIPTSLSLTDEEVDEVEALAPRLLKRSEDFQRFVLTLP